ncbi:MAG: hypothetical protein ABI864_06990 [Chloroflexota bacterium]
MAERRVPGAQATKLDPGLPAIGTYCYPNLIPLSDAEVRHILETVRGYPYERVYSLWQGRVITTDGDGALQRSADRYLAHR